MKDLVGSGSGSGGSGGSGSGGSGGNSSFFIFSVFSVFSAELLLLPTISKSFNLCFVGVLSRPYHPLFIYIILDFNYLINLNSS